MMIKKTIAKAMAAISLQMAKKAGGAATTFGSYQPKEPEVLKRLKK